MQIETLDAAGLDAALDDLTEILHATVLGGASVNFILPFTADDARRFWVETVRPGVEAGTRILFVAAIAGRVGGTVQLALAPQPNQAHRADVTKLLVHPAARRMGLGRMLMEAAEESALAMGRTLLTLDTRAGDAAEPLYRSLDYVAIGTIPGYARAPDADRLEAATFFYKTLG